MHRICTLAEMPSAGIDLLQQRRLAWIPIALFVWSLTLTILLVSNPIDVWSAPESDRGVMARVIEWITPVNRLSSSP